MNITKEQIEDIEKVFDDSILKISESLDKHLREICDRLEQLEEIEKIKVVDVK